MINPRGGKKITIQGIDCHLPPIPDKLEIQNWELPKKEQKWSRTIIPKFKPTDIDIWDGFEYDPSEEIDWDEASRQEFIKQTGTDNWDLDRQNNPKPVSGVEDNPYYVMEALDNFRRQEFDRIFDGHWVYINGNPIYLTGPYYFYLNYWQLDDGYPEFRETDLELFYFWEAIRNSPIHLGIIYITMRGVGKSYVAGCLDYYEAITNKNVNTGIQSKSDTDARDFFRTKVLQPVSKLPNFLVPINKHVGDITENNNLDFSPPSKKNKTVRYFKKLQRDSLRSFMDYRNAGEFAYDSTTLRFLVQDEIGKTHPQKIADVKERLQKNKFCVWRGTKKRGNIFATSTVEKLEEGGKECKAIWNDSNVNDYGQNTRTRSGLVKFFVSALDASFFDEYGFSLRDKAREYHEAERKKLENDPVALVGEKQKNPFNEEEAFMIGGKNCIYNAAILQEAYQRATDPDRNLYRVGDFEWVEKDKEARFVDNKINGKWHVSYLIKDPKHANRVQIKSSNNETRFSPSNNDRYCMAFDPFSAMDLVDDNKGSNAAACVYKKFDYHEDDFYCDTIVADYRHRPDDPFDSFEDVIIAAFYFGCNVLIENNKSNALDYFRHRGYSWGSRDNQLDFVMTRPESTFTNSSNTQATPGIPSNKPTIGHYINVTKSHIVNNGHKLKHPRVIEDWLEFEPNKTTKYDSAVAASYSLVANEKIITFKKEKINLGEVFSKYDNSQQYSKVN